MKIHKLWAENVKGITKKVEVDLSPTGLNIISAPNEMGKTTIAEVLNYLFQWKSSSQAEEIQNLKPYGKDVGPLMGAIIEVEGQTYEIEKRWLKEKKTEVKLISPESKELDGPEADKMIDKIFKHDLDETIWKMVQVAQANFSDLLDKEFNDDRRAALSDYLARAVVDAEGFDDANLLEKVDQEYLKWWTPKGKPATALGTSGRLIVEKLEILDKLKSDVAFLQDKIDDAAQVEEEIVVKKESQEVLQNRKKAQDAHRELETAQRELRKRTEARDKIDQLLESNPAIQDFSQDLFDAINDDRALHAQYNALSSIKLTGLSDLSVDINGTSVSIAKGESKDQKLESPLNITIPNMLSISYESDTNSAVGLELGAKRFTENLMKMGCETFQEAQELSRQYKEFQNLTQNLSALLGVYSLETLQSVINKNEAVKAGLPNWDIDVELDLVTEKDLVEVAQQVGNKEGRSEEISHNGWHTTLEETIEKIADNEKRLEALNRKAQAARLLFEVLTEHKESAEKDYSVHFAKYINDLAKSFYGLDVHFEVSDSFKILRRRIGTTEVDIADLSTGAKEQLAILIRLALTQIVQVGEPFPVILDDEFAHSDPDRIAMMNNIFSDFGDDQQFIMLTCTPEKFSGYKPVKTIDLAALRSA